MEDQIILKEIMAKCLTIDTHTHAHTHTHTHTHTHIHRAKTKEVRQKFFVNVHTL